MQTFREASTVSSMLLINTPIILLLYDDKKAGKESSPPLTAPSWYMMPTPIKMHDNIWINKLNCSSTSTKLDVAQTAYIIA
jgi:hypothetical protein